MNIEKERDGGHLGSSHTHGQSMDIDTAISKQIRKVLVWCGCIINIELSILSHHQSGKGIYICMYIYMCVLMCLITMII